MIKLTIKPEYRDDHGEADIPEAEQRAAAPCAALREAGIEIGASDFADAWGEHSAELFAGWLSIDTRNLAYILSQILPYCDIEAGDPRGDRLITKLSGLSPEGYPRQAYGIISQLVPKR